MAIPHNSKCRYGERGAAAARPKAQIILDAAKVSAASGGNSKPKQGQRSQSARGFCPRSTMRVPQPDIIEHFGNADQVDFCRRLPYSIKLFLRFSSRIPVFAFFFSVKLPFGLNNFKITAFPPHHWVMPGSGRPSPAALFRCFSLPYVVTALFIEEFLCQFLMSSKIPHCFSFYRPMVLYRMFVLFYAGFFRHFPILYIL